MREKREREQTHICSRTTTHAAGREDTQLSFLTHMHTHRTDMVVVPEQAFVLSHTLLGMYLSPSPSLQPAAGREDSDKDAARSSGDANTTQGSEVQGRASKTIDQGEESERERRERNTQLRDDDDAGPVLDCISLFIILLVYKKDREERKNLNTGLFASRRRRCPFRLSHCSSTARPGARQAEISTLAINDFWFLLRRQRRGKRKERERGFHFRSLKSKLLLLCVCVCVCVCVCPVPAPLYVRVLRMCVHLVILFLQDKHDMIF